MAVKVGKLVSVAFAWALVPTAAVLVLASAHWIASGDRGLFLLSWALALHVVAGAAASYVLHEVGHVIAMGMLCRDIRSIDVRSGFLTFSIIPQGTITRSESILVALSGPAVCGLFGLLLLQTTGSSVGWWYIAHTLFLIPPFGDGMSIVRALRTRSATTA